MPATLRQMRQISESVAQSRLGRIGRTPAVNGIVGLGIVVLLAVQFGSASYNTFVMETVAIYAIAVYGLDIAAGYAGVLSLGSGAAFAVGGYAVADMAVKLGQPIWVCLPVAIGFGFLLGVVMGLPAMAIGGLGIGFISLGFALIAGNVATNATALTGGNYGISGVVARLGFGTASPPIAETTFVILLFVLLYVVYVFHAAYRRSRFGRSALTVRDNPLGARALGINVGAVQVLAVATASGLGALAGGLYTYSNQFVSTDITALSISILFIVMVVFGGMGNTYGPLLGAAIISPLPIVLSSHPGLNQYIYAGLLLVVVLLRPRGLAGWTAVRARLPGLERTSTIGSPEGVAVSPVVSSLATPAASATPATTLAAERRSSLRCEQLSRAFGGVLALDGVDLDVGAGEVVAVVGPNGSGKTTLLNVVSGFYPPTSGRVWLGDRDVSGLGPVELARLGIGRTFQTPKVFADLAISEHVRLGLDHQVTPSSHDSESGRPADDTYLAITYSLLRGSGMDWTTGKESRSLAHGQRRFLEVAMAIARGPHLLLLDEPASGLSTEEQTLLTHAIRRIADAGTAVVLVEHHLELVHQIADRIVVLHLGHLLWSGVPTELASSPEVRDAYLGRTVR